MSPVPIIARQRALSRVGEIRTGGEKPERGAGKKLETFRLTSQHRDIIDRCAGLYGGAPSEWQSPNGKAWQLYTESAALPCWVIVNYSLTLMYERWEGATKCVRRCDGEEEFLTSGPCICNLEGEDQCDIVTRLMVVLPETGTSLGWQLRSIGENASRELAGAIDLADSLAKGKAFVPATLRLTQRRGTKDGQVVRYSVPVLDFNIETLALVAGSAEDRLALPVGYTPLQNGGNGVSVDEALAAAERGAEPATRSARSAASIGEAEEFASDEPLPVDETPAAEAKPLTTAQAKKLNVLVGQLRDAGHITTEQLWGSLGRRPSPSDVDAEGMLHWSPLRDSLSKDEASSLIDRLERYQATLAEQATA
jgi:hypothetical protein